MGQPVIELTGLTKKYGGFTAVNDLNLTINKKDIFGLLGLTEPESLQRS